MLLQGLLPLPVCHKNKPVVHAVSSGLQVLSRTLSILRAVERWKLTRACIFVELCVALGCASM